MELTDIMPVEEWKALQVELSEKFGLNADVVDKEGKKLAGVTWGNDLCKTLREDKKGFSSICATAGSMFTQLAQSGEPYVEECDAIMMRISIPVKKDGELLGAVGGCGLVSDEEEVDEFTVGMMSDLKEEQIEELAKTVKVVSEDRVKEIQDYIQGRIDGVVG